MTPSAGQVGTSSQVLNNLNAGLDVTSRVIELAPAILSLVQILESIFKARNSGSVKKAVITSALAGESVGVQNVISGMVDQTIAAQKASAVVGQNSINLQDQTVQQGNMIQGMHAVGDVVQGS